RKAALGSVPARRCLAARWPLVGGGPRPPAAERSGCDRFHLWGPRAKPSPNRIVCAPAAVTPPPVGLAAEGRARPQPGRGAPTARPCAPRGRATAPVRARAGRRARESGSRCCRGGLNRRRRRPPLGSSLVDRRPDLLGQPCRGQAIRAFPQRL